MTDAARLRFDRPIAPDGYCWWYLDALSEDGRYGITLIAFLGSVFSPHYAAARRRGPTDPLQHCCMHVALYGAGGGRWAMTERGARDVLRYEQALTIGLSALLWDGTTLSFAIDEVTAPWPSRLRGTVRVHVDALTRHTVSLDAAGRHRWSPLAPRARVEVAMTQPDLSWNGPGYLDSNEGDEPLEAAFASWTWSRASLREGAAVLYDVQRRDGSALNVALRIGADGAVEPFASPPVAALSPTLWRLPRSTRADAGHRAAVERTLTDAPFYARSVVRTHLLGEKVTAMHEALSLRRFVTQWVQLMLPFRAPRAWR
jgi:carotenoid 1,2-hydratase